MRSCGWAACCTGSKQLDRELQARPPHPVMGTASLHASMIEGGREWSSYPDRCVLQMERRTVAGETAAAVEREVRADPRRAARTEDPEFEAAATCSVFASAVRDAAGCTADQLDAAAGCARSAVSRRRGGWNEFLDRCGGARGGGNSVGAVRPGGAGLHSIEEYVNVADVLACRDVLADSFWRGRGVALGLTRLCPNLTSPQARPEPEPLGRFAEHQLRLSARDAARRLRSAGAARGR